MTQRRALKLMLILHSLIRFKISSTVCDDAPKVKCLQGQDHLQQVHEAASGLYYQLQVPILHQQIQVETEVGDEPEGGDVGGKIIFG